jgi:hypothetical protein
MLFRDVTRGERKHRRDTETAHFIDRFGWRFFVRPFNTENEILPKYFKFTTEI